jgi:nucleoside-diphosphate-sugar epimerase
VSGYPGDGVQRWPAVHALDAAVLFRLALEHAPTGSSWHAVADEGDAVRDIAGVIGRRLGLAVENVPQETFGPAARSSQPTSRRRAPRPATRSGGTRRTRASWRTWRASDPDALLKTPERASNKLPTAAGSSARICLRSERCEPASYRRL